MSKIKVKNFGPIKEGFNENDGFLDIKKITVFIGDQGSGKSTVAKLISTCKWLEKAMNRGDINTEIHFAEFAEYLRYQGILNYFSHNSSVIKYSGNAFIINYSYPHLEVTNTFSERYDVPKIMYVPAERNLFGITDAGNLYRDFSNALFDFGSEFKRINYELPKDTFINLPINSLQYGYDKSRGIPVIRGADFSVTLYESSSGLQSMAPLYVVTRDLSLITNKELINNKDNISINQLLKRNELLQKILSDTFLSESQRSSEVDKVWTKYHNSCFINIVEEPEQNLFPESQRHILNSLLGFANKQEANELLMTTHSPYIINYLSIAIQGKHLLDKINTSSKKEELLSRLNEIVPIEACVAAEDVAIYQFQNDGSICRLGSYEGIPSDKNYLNQSLAEGNQLFDALLELEEEL